MCIFAQDMEEGGCDDHICCCSVCKSGNDDDIGEDETSYMHNVGWKIV